MLICISSILSTIHPEPLSPQISSLLFIISYVLFKLDLWSVIVTDPELK